MIIMWGLEEIRFERICQLTIAIMLYSNQQATLALNTHLSLLTGLQIDWALDGHFLEPKNDDIA